MNTKKYKWILYFIVITIITTIAIQFYWNYKNYEENKQQVANEIQLSLDNAIEEYFAKLAKEEFTTIIDLNSKTRTSEDRKIKFDSIFKNSTNFQKFKSLIKADNIKEKSEVKITDISFISDNVLDVKKTDSLLKRIARKLSSRQKKVPKKTFDTLDTNFKYFSGKKAADSLKLIKNLKPIFLSLSTSYIEYPQLDSLLQNQFDKKKIPLQFVFNHLKSDTIFYSTKDSLVSKKFSKEISSKSTYLKKDEKFQLLYNNSNTEALKRSVFGIFLSLLLSLAVISSLFYLLKIIRQQKELAEIKNDLISNITHEFKTPIATVAAALEALENFNANEDKKKTKKYLSISSTQLKKLHQMVEKLLETATLDSEHLLLNKEPHDMAALIDKITQKHRNLAIGTTINFSTNSDFLSINIDVFHFENAISNLIDNAVKYGGSIIEVRINVLSNTIEISVKDNGNGIGKSEQEKIFDKFYRVSKGNTHDVKGFGIGLYYSKKIIEKHNGTIRLVSNSKNTIFKITLPK